MAKVVEDVDAKHKPDAIILVTDGYTDWPSRPTKARLIVVLTEDCPTPAWSKTIKVPAELKGVK
jgi:predicted metal-dependent peptidase